MEHLAYDDKPERIATGTNIADVEVKIDNWEVPCVSVQIESSMPPSGQVGIDSKANRIHFATAKGLVISKRFLGLLLMKRWEMIFHFYCHIDKIAVIEYSLTNPISILPIEIQRHEATVEGTKQTFVPPL